jgi:prepilin-type processing-associated H-X9-DG protein
MDRLSRRAFTLVELLVVILIIMILMMLLVPTLQAAIQTAYATQCKSNLSTIYKAEVECMHQSEASTFVAKGQGWNNLLLTFLENRTEVFQCPACQGRIEDTGSSIGGTPGTPGTPSGPPTPPSAGTAPPKVEGFDISFNVFSGTSFSTLLWNVSANNATWRKTTVPYDAKDASMDPAYTWRIEIEDRGFLVEETGNWSWADDYCDIDVAITYSGSTPKKIKIIQHKNGSQGYRYDMLINGQMVLHNLDANQGWTMSFGADDSGSSGGSGSGGTSGGSGSSGGSAPVFMPYIKCDYGINRGAYEVPGVDVSRIDEKLFFILDYPKRVADYITGGTDVANWYSYFFANPIEWKPPTDYPGTTWMQTQALRHFGKANVLFMDGHIESLPGFSAATDDINNGRCLNSDSPYWQYGRPRPN